MQSFKIIKPLPALVPYIRYYWMLEDDSVTPVSERTLPVGCLQLVFHRGKRLLSLKESELQPQSFVCGQTTGFSDVLSTGKIEMIVVVFQPYAARVFLNVPANLFNGGNISFGDLGDIELSVLSERIIEAQGSDSCIQLIEEFLLRRLCKSSMDDYDMKRISAVLNGINIRPQISISQLSGIACLGSKQLGRIFVDNVGTTPKEFIRIIRMQRALYKLQLDENLSFSQLAYECGFSDQSHLIREFKSFSGYTPKEYLSICTPHSDYFSTI